MDGGSGIPVSKFGDAKAPSTYHRTGGGTSGTMYDSIFSKAVETWIQMLEILT